MSQFSGIDPVVVCFRLIFRNTQSAEIANRHECKYVNVLAVIRLEKPACRFYGILLSANGISIVFAEQGISRFMSMPSGVADEPEGKVQIFRHFFALLVMLRYR